MVVTDEGSEEGAASRVFKVIQEEFGAGGVVEMNIPTLLDLSFVDTSSPAPTPAEGGGTERLLPLPVTISIAAAGGALALYLSFVMLRRWRRRRQKPPIEDPFSGGRMYPDETVVDADMREKRDDFSEQERTESDYSYQDHHALPVVTKSSFLDDDGASQNEGSSYHSEHSSASESRTIEEGASGERSEEDDLISIHAGEGGLTGRIHFTRQSSLVSEITEPVDLQGKAPEGERMDEGSQMPDAEPVSVIGLAALGIDQFSEIASINPSEAPEQSYLGLAALGIGFSDTETSVATEAWPGEHDEPDECTNVPLSGHSEAEEDISEGTETMKRGFDDGHLDQGHSEFSDHSRALESQRDGDEYSQYDVASLYSRGGLGESGSEYSPRSQRSVENDGARSDDVSIYSRQPSFATSSANGQSIIQGGDHHGSSSPGTGSGFNDNESLEVWSGNSQEHSGEVPNNRDSTARHSGIGSLPSESDELLPSNSIAVSGSVVASVDFDGEDRGAEFEVSDEGSVGASDDADGEDPGSVRATVDFDSDDLGSTRASVRFDDDNGNDSVTDFDIEDHRSARTSARFDGDHYPSESVAGVDGEDLESAQASAGLDGDYQYDSETDFDGEDHGSSRASVDSEFNDRYDSATGVHGEDHNSTRESDSFEGDDQYDTTRDFDDEDHGSARASDYDSVTGIDHRSAAGGSVGFDGDYRYDSTTGYEGEDQGSARAGVDSEGSDQCDSVTGVDGEDPRFARTSAGLGGDDQYDSVTGIDGEDRKSAPPSVSYQYDSQTDYDTSARASVSSEGNDQHDAVTGVDGEYHESAQASIGFAGDYRYDSTTNLYDDHSSERASVSFGGNDQYDSPTDIVGEDHASAKASADFDYDYRYDSTTEYDGSARASVNLEGDGLTDFDGEDLGSARASANFDGDYQRDSATVHDSEDHRSLERSVDFEGDGRYDSVDGEDHGSAQASVVSEDRYDSVTDVGSGEFLSEGSAGAGSDYHVNGSHGDAVTNDRTEVFHAENEDREFSAGEGSLGRHDSVADDESAAHSVNEAVEETSRQTENRHDTFPRQISASDFDGRRNSDHTDSLSDRNEGSETNISPSAGREEVVEADVGKEATVHHQAVGDRDDEGDATDSERVFDGQGMNRDNSGQWEAITASIGRIYDSGVDTRDRSSEIGEASEDCDSEGASWERGESHPDAPELRDSVISSTSTASPRGLDEQPNDDATEITAEAQEQLPCDEDGADVVNETLEERLPSRVTDSVQLHDERNLSASDDGQLEQPESGEMSRREVVEDTLTGHDNELLSGLVSEKEVVAQTLTGRDSHCTGAGDLEHQSGDDKQSALGEERLEGLPTRASEGVDRSLDKDSLRDKQTTGDAQEGFVVVEGMGERPGCRADAAGSEANQNENDQFIGSSARTGMEANTGVDYRNSDVVGEGLAYDDGEWYEGDIHPDDQDPSERGNSAEVSFRDDDSVGADLHSGGDNDSTRADFHSVIDFYDNEDDAGLDDGDVVAHSMESDWEEDDSQREDYGWLNEREPSPVHSSGDDGTSIEERQRSTTLDGFVEESNGASLAYVSPGLRSASAVFTEDRSSSNSSLRGQIEEDHRLASTEDCAEEERSIRSADDSPGPSAANNVTILLMQPIHGDIPQINEKPRRSSVDLREGQIAPERTAQESFGVANEPSRKEQVSAQKVHMIDLKRGSQEHQAQGGRETGQEGVGHEENGRKPVAKSSEIHELTAHELELTATSTVSERSSRGEYEGRNMASGHASSTLREDDFTDEDGRSRNAAFVSRGYDEAVKGDVASTQEHGECIPDDESNTLSRTDSKEGEARISLVEPFSSNSVLTTGDGGSEIPRYVESAPSHDESSRALSVGDGMSTRDDRSEKSVEGTLSGNLSWHEETVVDATETNNDSGSISRRSAHSEDRSWKSTSSRRSYGVEAGLSADEAHIADKSWHGEESSSKGDDRSASHRGSAQSGDRSLREADTSSELGGDLDLERLSQESGHVQDRSWREDSSSRGSDLTEHDDASERLSPRDSEGKSESPPIGAGVELRQDRSMSEPWRRDPSSRGDANPKDNESVSHEGSTHMDDRSCHEGSISRGSGAALQETSSGRVSQNSNNGDRSWHGASSSHNPSATLPSDESARPSVGDNSPDGSCISKASSRGYDTAGVDANADRATREQGSWHEGPSPAVGVVLRADGESESQADSSDHSSWRGEAISEDANVPDAEPDRTSQDSEGGGERPGREESSSLSSVATSQNGVVERRLHADSSEPEDMSMQTMSVDLMDDSANPDGASREDRFQSGESSHGGDTMLPRDDESVSPAEHEDRSLLQESNSSDAVAPSSEPDRMSFESSDTPRHGDSPSHDHGVGVQDDASDGLSQTTSDWSDDGKSASTGYDMALPQDESGQGERTSSIGESSREDDVGIEDDEIVSDDDSEYVGEEGSTGYRSGNLQTEYEAASAVENLALESIEDRNLVQGAIDELSGEEPGSQQVDASPLQAFVDGDADENSLDHDSRHDRPKKTEEESGDYTVALRDPEKQVNPPVRGREPVRRMASDSPTLIEPLPDRSSDSANRRRTPDETIGKPASTEIGDQEDTGRDSESGEDGIECASSESSSSSFSDEGQRRIAEQLVARIHADDLEGTRHLDIDTGDDMSGDWESEQPIDAHYVRTRVASRRTREPSPSSRGTEYDESSGDSRDSQESGQMARERDRLYGQSDLQWMAEGNDERSESLADDPHVRIVSAANRSYLPEGRLRNQEAMAWRLPSGGRMMPDSSRIADDLSSARESVSTNDSSASETVWREVESHIDEAFSRFQMYREDSLQSLPEESSRSVTEASSGSMSLDEGDDESQSEEERPHVRRSHSEGGLPGHSNSSLARFFESQVSWHEFDSQVADTLSPPHTSFHTPTPTPTYQGDTDGSGRVSFGARRQHSHMEDSLVSVDTATRERYALGSSNVYPIYDDYSSPAQRSHSGSESLPESSGENSSWEPHDAEEEYDESEHPSDDTYGESSRQSYETDESSVEESSVEESSNPMSDESSVEETDQSSVEDSSYDEDGTRDDERSSGSDEVGYQSVNIYDDEGSLSFEADTIHHESVEAPSQIDYRDIYQSSEDDHSEATSYDDETPRESDYTEEDEEGEEEEHHTEDETSIESDAFTSPERYYEDAEYPPRESRSFRAELSERYEDDWASERSARRRYLLNRERDQSYAEEDEDEEDERTAPFWGEGQDFPTLPANRLQDRDQTSARLSDDSWIHSDEQSGDS